MNKDEIKREFIKWCDEPMSANGNDREEMFEKIYQAGVKAERARCAKVAEKYANRWADTNEPVKDDVAIAIAAAIRKRGDKHTPKS